MKVYKENDTSWQKYNYIKRKTTKCCYKINLKKGNVLGWLSEIYTTYGHGKSFVFITDEYAKKHGYYTDYTEFVEGEK